MENVKKIWNVFTDHHVYRTVNLIIFIFYFVISDFNIDYIPYIFSFFWGIILLAWDFFTDRLLFKQSYWYLLLAFLISYFVSILLNLPANLLHGGMNFVYLAISIFIFYVINPNECKEKIFIKFQNMNDIYISITFILSVIGLIMFVFSISFLSPEGARQGFYHNRLFGLYTSPNIGGMFGFISVVFGLINNYFKRGSWRRFQPFYIINSLVQFLFYVLATSRGTMLAVYSFIIFISFSIIIKILILEKDKFQKVLVSSLMTIGILTSFSFIADSTKIMLSYTPSIIESIVTKSDEGEEKVSPNKDESQNQDKEQIKPVVIEHSGEGAEVSSGRFTIWEAGLQLFKQRPIFGISDDYVYRYGTITENLHEENLSELNINELKRARGNMHNTYIAILVQTGIVGTLIIATFVILLFKENLIFLLRKETLFQDEETQLFIIIFALLLSFFVNDLVESHILFNNRDVMGLVFWSYAGFLNYLRINSSRIKTDAEAKSV